MSLAQVVYQISTDNDFAAQWRQDPEAALAGKGLKLSPEEMAFLSAGLQRSRVDDTRKVRLSEVVQLARGWQ
jgi:hypothetical protein